MADHALTPLRSLSFGSFASAYEGTLTITPEGARIGTGGVIPISQILGTPGELRFVTAYDQAATPCRVTIPSQITLRNTIGSGGEMLATDFIYRLLPPRAFGVGRVARHIKVGATLHVKAQQAPGNYVGTMPTIVEYE